MQADLVLFNGLIHTMDREQPLVEAIAAHCGRIIAVGDSDDVRALTGPSTEHIDLHGRLVVPGFTDAHIHLVNYGLSLERVQLDGVTSLEEAVGRVAERACITQQGEWVLGWGWNRNLWPGAPFPSKDDLNPVTPDNPVFLKSKDGHAAWVNSQALEIAGISAATPNPPGGVYERNPETGELTGVLKENPAIDIMIKAAGPAPLTERMRAIKAAQERLHRYGVVGVHVPEEEHEFAALQRAWLEGHLKLRVSFMIADKHLDGVLRMGLRPGFGDDFLRLSNVKAYADGSLGSRTADMLAPYKGQVGNRGVEVSSSEYLSDLVSRCATRGWSPAIHAIGDRANHRVLHALEEHWQEWSRRDLRPRVEHAQLLAPQDVARLGTMGVIASMQPMHCTSDLLMAERYWGSRCSGAFAWRSLLECGTVLAFGSDAPVEEPSVLRGIFAAVTRQREDGTPAGGWYPEQCLSVPEAIYAYTVGAAYASGEEHIKGSLRVGKQADMVVLSKNIFELPPQEILNTRVETTILAGEIVYRLA